MHAHDADGLVPRLQERGYPFFTTKSKLYSHACDTISVDESSIEIHWRNHAKSNSAESHFCSFRYSLIEPGHGPGAWSGRTSSGRASQQRCCKSHLHEHCFGD